MIRIAIVDDHQMVREGVRAMLRDEPDFKIVGDSADADDIREFVAATQPDVLLLDARLPRVSGPEACRLLSVSNPEVKVIILTVYTDDALVEQSIAAGARGYIIKDVEGFDLKQYIRAVHRGQAVLSPSIAGVVMDRMRTQLVSPAAGAIRPVFSDTQRQILRLISEGYTNREIATRVHLSENTVKSHVQEILTKLGVRNRVAAAISAVRRGLV
jgi:two-component system, NarL family, response regulator DevR